MKRIKKDKWMLINGKFRLVKAGDVLLTIDGGLLNRKRTMIIRKRCV